jgi:murein DD-endopeptidase MepM/ murein hydrolase activator NlpD
MATNDEDVSKLMDLDSMNLTGEAQKRTQNINSLTATLVKHQEKTDKSLMEIRKSIMTIAKDQSSKQKNIKETMSSTGGFREVDRSLVLVLKKLGGTLEQVGRGALKMTASTALATKDMLKQYGAAISEDIHVNKQSMVAMALSQTSPIFGYFAAKFMETSVFKSAKEKIKNAFVSIFASIGASVKQLFTRGKEKVSEIRTQRKTSRQKEEIPKLQTGGYVTRGGAAMLHAAEVVAPLQKLQFVIQKAFFPTTKVLSSLAKQMAMFMFFQKVKMVFKAIRWIRASRYNKYLSKDTDPLRKLAADFGTFFSMTFERRDVELKELKDKALGAASEAKGKVKEIYKNTIKDAKESKAGTLLSKFRNKTAKFYDSSIKSFKENKRANELKNDFLKKIKKHTAGMENKLGFFGTMFRKMQSSLPTWIMMGIGLLKTALGTIFAPIKKLLAPALLALRHLRHPILLLKRVGAFLWKNLTKFGKILGKVMIFAGAAMSLLDMGLDARAGVKKAREWHNVKEGQEVSTSQKVTAGIGAALGGTESGVKGALSGALKGAGLGMAIGSIVPGIGTAIGGAIGAIAGGLMGFVGGKNIAQGLQFVWDKAKPFIEGVVDVVMYPFRLLGRLKDRFMEWFQDPEKSLFDKVKDVGNSILNVLSWPSRMFYGMGAGILRFILNNIPDALKKVLPNFILNGVKNTADLFEKASNTTFNTDNKSLVGASKKALETPAKGTVSSAAPLAAAKANAAKGAAPAKGAASPAGSLAAAKASSAEAKESSVTSKISETVSSAVKAGSEMAAQAVEMGKTAVETVKPIVSTAVESGKEMAKGAVETISKSKAVEAGKGVAKGAVEVIQGMGDKISNLALIASELKSKGMNVPAILAALGNVLKESGGIPKSENMNYSKTSNDRIRKIFGSRARGKSEEELNIAKSDPAKMGELMYGFDTNIGRSMGHTAPGEGYKYRGRGFIQLTGKNNYLAAGSAIGIPLVDNPDLANKPNVAAKITAWFLDKNRKSAARKLGIDINSSDQLQQNSIITQAIGGLGLNLNSPIGQELLNKVSQYTQSPAIQKIASAAFGAASSIADKATDAVTYGKEVATSAAAEAGKGVVADVGKTMAAKINGMLALPTESTVVTSDFGPRNTGLSGASKNHKGIDLRAAMGAPIYAMADGVVSGTNSTWGKISIKHKDGFTSEYMHLSSMKVKPGDEIKKGQLIGLSGKTGPIPGMAPHLHHSIKSPDGIPINPRTVYAAAGIKLQSKGGAGSKEMGGPMESLIGPSIDKNYIVDSQTTDQMLRNNILKQILYEFKNTTEEFLKDTQKHSSAVISNVTNAFSTNNRTTIQGITNALQKANSQPSNALREVLNGDFN